MTNVLLYQCGCVVYLCCRLEDMGAAAHLNTSFKHFIFFVWEFDLVDQRELAALSRIVGELRINYEEQRSSRK